jgi:hypothetical protein
MVRLIVSLVLSGRTVSEELPIHGLKKEKIYYYVSLYSQSNKKNKKIY